jgi:hypothetical protein
MGLISIGGIAHSLADSKFYDEVNQPDDAAPEDLKVEQRGLHLAARP